MDGKSFVNSQKDGQKQRAINRMIHSGSRRHAHLLFTNFDREDEEVQLSIVFAMRMIANKKSKAILIEMMSNDSLTDPVRAALTEIVGDLGLRELRPIVRAQLRHPCARVRFFSCEALWILHVEAERDEDVAALEALVSDPVIGWEGQTVGEAAHQAIRILSG